MKKIFYFIIILVCLCIPNTQVSANDWFFNGTHGGSGSSVGTGSCKGWDGMCLYNSMNNFGMRFSLVKCDKNGNCTNVTRLNTGSGTVSIHTVDLWKTELYTGAQNFHFYGTTRASGTLKDKKGSYSFTTLNKIPLKKISNTSGDGKYLFGPVTRKDPVTEKQITYKYFYINNIEDMTYIDEILMLMSDGKINRNLLMNNINYGEHKSSEGTDCKDCYGYRIFVEPVFTFKHKEDASEDWILTYAEFVRYYGDKKGTTKTNIDNMGNSLLTTYNDVKLSKGTKGLNIIDPLLGQIPPQLTCEKIEQYYFSKGWNLKNDLKGTLTIDANGNTISGEWYVNNCTCDGIYNYYYSQKNTQLFDLDKRDIQNLFEKDHFFDNFNKQEFKVSDYLIAPNVKWTYSHYSKLNCGFKTPSGGTVTPPDNKIDCTPEYNLFDNGNPGQCYVGQLSYADSNDWNNCIFNANGTNDLLGSSYNNTTYKDNNLSNKYCEIYCTETFNTNFNKDAITVKAGSYFTWNHSVNGSRTCKTKSIDWNTFRTDLNTANTTAQQKYNALLKAEAQNNAIQNSTKTTTQCGLYCDTNLSADNTTSGKCCVERVEKQDPMNCACNNAVICRPGDTNCTPKQDTKNCACYTEKHYTCTKEESPTYHGVMMQPANSKYGTNLSKWCSTESKIADYQKAYKDALTAYNAVKNTPESIVESMKSCSDWDSNKLYTLNPSIKYHYSDDINYTEFANKDLNSQNKVVDNGTTVDKKCTEQKVTYYDDATKKLITTTIEKCSNVEMTKSQSVYISIPDWVYRYVDKQDHYSFHADELASRKAMYQAHYTFNYFDTGIGNFPVSFQKLAGTYGSISGGGVLELIYSDLGHKYGNSNTMVDKALNDTNLGTVDYGKYQCDYNVINGLIDDPNNPRGNGGINLIYRPIDLDNPFPNIDAKGRNTGANWCNGYDCSKDNDVVKAVIKNNRDVKSEELYNLEPMYTFILTPSDINKIRKYNRQNSYTNYYGTLNKSEQYFDFKCENGTNCISEYLTYLINNYGKGGSCSSNISATRKQYFDTCR